MRKAIIVVLLLLIVPVVSAQPVVDDVIPDPMPLAERPEGDDMSVFLLIGAGNNSLQEKAGLTDMLMLVAVNRTRGTASMLHIPRDYWAFVPGFGMHKINQAFYMGETHEVEGGGIEVLRQTLEYNLGITVDYYAAIDFNGFLGVIDQIGGVRIPVDCIIQDYKLKSRELDKRVADNYELFTLPIGVHTLDADTALWYIRSRITSSDLDRGRRTQDVLRAVWRKVRSENMLTTLPALWDSISRYLLTDLTLTDLLGYVPFALNMDADRIEQYRFKMGTHIQNALGPAPDYQSILAPIDREAVAELVEDFLTPPTRNQITLAGLRIEVINSGGVNGMATVAADRLSQEGFSPTISAESTHYRDFTAIYDFTGQERGSPIPTFQRLFRVTADGVITQPDPNRTVDYKIYVGNTYSVWACTRNVIQPKWPPEDVETPTPTP